MSEQLVGAWLGACPEREPVAIRDEASVSQVREWVRREGAALRLPTTMSESVAIVMSELAHNQLAHARRGEVLVRPLHRDGVPGLEVIAADGGRGLQDAAAALRGRASSSGSLGVGLGGVLRLSDEVDFDVRREEGLCVTARKFAAPVAPRPQVALLGRPCRGERRSGDHGLVLRCGDALLLGVIDGLGHWEAARGAADRAVAVLRQSATAGQGGTPTPATLLERCDQALHGSRGAVAAVALLHGDGLFAHAAVGNVTTQLVSQDGSRRLPSQAGVLGLDQHRAQGGKGAHSLGAQLLRGDLLLMFTDGLTGRLSLQDEPALRRQHPLLIAEALLSRYGRAHDDALLLVVR